MAENEESEIAGEFGRTLRLALAGAMQAREVAARRAQMSAAQQQAETERQRQGQAVLARSVGQELHSAQFWKKAGSESIADHVTVAAHLAQHHPEARLGYMHAADRLRNDYGINIEQINRDHPNALAERHAALRDALDDYFDRYRQDDHHDAAQETQQQQQLESEDQTQTASREADSAAAVTEEAADLDKASDRQAEAHLDRMNTMTAEQAGDRQPETYQRMTPEQLAQIERAANNPELAGVRGRQSLTFGSPTGQRTQAASQTLGRARSGRDLTQGKVQEAGLSR